MGKLKKQFSDMRANTPKRVQWLLLVAAFVVVIILITLLMSGKNNKKTEELCKHCRFIEKCDKM